MNRRLPVFATLVVMAAVAVMVRLGFWQLERMAEKEALLARFAVAASLPSAVPWPDAAASDDAGSPAWNAVLYRRSQFDCSAVAGISAMAGQNIAGGSGMAHVADCRLADGRQARAVLGWSRNPVSPDWRGGTVTGWIAPGPRLVADPPLAGLEANARPDPSTIPNNHLSYAVQWFLFAVTALVIYGLALWKRIKAERPGE